MTADDISLDCSLCSGAEGGSNLWSDVYNLAEDICHRVYVVASEALAVLLYNLPNAIAWCHRRFWNGTIAHVSLTAVFDGVTKAAGLFVHQTEKLGSSPGVAVLLLHGDHGHPFSTLHLADLAAKEKIGHIYSIHLPYDDKKPEQHQALLAQAIDKIESAVRGSDGCFRGIVAIGHSRGAIEAAHCAYVTEDDRISRVISIAGRFKVTPPPDRAPRVTLEPIVRAIDEALARIQPTNFYQVAAGEDWCIPLEASLTIGDPARSLLVGGAMHLNVLFHSATLLRLSAWLRTL